MRLKAVLHHIRRWVAGRRFTDTIARHHEAADRLDAAVREVLKR